MASEAQVRVDQSTFYAFKLERADSTRDRICRAVVELIAAHGYERTSLRMVEERAGIMAAEFKREFDDLEEAAVAAYDEMTAQYVKTVEGTFGRASGPWRDKLRAAAYGSARLLRDNPVDSRFGAYELMRASPLAHTHRDAMLEPLIDVIDLGRHLTDPRRNLTRATAEATVGSIVAAVTGQIAVGSRTDAGAYVPQLMYVAVRPYLGLRAAEEELTTPPPTEAG